MGKPETTRLFRRARNGWEDNIEMGLQEIGWNA
jgi:hypothetical protein